jgi:ferredoxin
MREKALRLDPIACDGHGICAELFPERISLDDWGYPIVDPTPIGDDLLPHAQRAVSNCPVLALRLEKVAAGGVDFRHRHGSPVGSERR